MFVISCENAPDEFLEYLVYAFHPTLPYLSLYTGAAHFEWWGVKDFEAREAREILLAPHPEVANRWGAYFSSVIF